MEELRNEKEKIVNEFTDRINVDKSKLDEIL